MPLLSAQALLKTYGGQAAVDGVQLAIAAGECFGLLGPNGAGKTATLRLGPGLAQPDGGEIRMFGLPAPEKASGLQRASVS